MSVRPLVMSASSLKKFDGCPRAWAFNKIERLEDPSGEAAEYGKLIHEQMENWIRDGVLPTNPHAIELMKHAPAPKTAWVEYEFSFEDNGLKWRGFIDALAAYDDGKTHLGESGTCLILDHKSTSDPYKYALRESDGLLVDEDGKPDVQSCLYSHWAFTVAGFERVVWRWNYVATKGAVVSKRVEVEANREHVARVYAGMRERANQARDLYAIRPKANDVPYRPSNCFAFRKKCIYDSVCSRPSGMFSASALDLDAGATTMNDFLASITTSFPVGSDEDAPPPPPPEEDDAPPPPPPEEDEHETQRMVDEYMASQRKPAIALGKPEAGFINAPEAASIDRAPATPEEAVAIFGAAPVAEPKVKKTRAKKGTKGQVAMAAVVEKEIAEYKAEQLPKDELPLDEWVLPEVNAYEEDQVLFNAYEEAKAAEEQEYATQCVEPKQNVAWPFGDHLRLIIREELRAYFSR